MNFVRHSPFFHEYDFPVSKVLEKYRDELIETYNTTPRPKNTHNIVLTNQKIYNYLSPNFYKLIQYWYNVPPPQDFVNIALYVQDKINYTSIFHSHVDNGATQTSLTATFYLHDLKNDEGGELEIAIPADPPIKIKTQKDKIYLFPNWLLHRPLPQTSNNIRICFNWGYVTDKKFIHRTSGDAW